MRTDSDSDRSVDWELLQAALDRGYFDTPSQVSLSELACHRGISEAETKRRLARGLSIVLQQRRDGALSSDGLLQDPTIRGL